MRVARGVLIAWLCFWALMYLLLTALSPWPPPREVFYARKVAQVALIVGTAAWGAAKIRNQR
jgi:hypothetical protein